jgi:hypothetical protein
MRLAYKTGDTMTRILAFTGLLSLACAIPRGAGEPLSIPISVSSNNKSSVDVYLLCGDRDAEWLGVVPSKVNELFEVPTSRARCVQGLNFFLVPRDFNRGYWVGPFQPQTGSSVHLTIEKYAGLSAARVDNDLR